MGFQEKIFTQWVVQAARAKQSQLLEESWTAIWKEGFRGLWAKCRQNILAPCASMDMVGQKAVSVLYSSITLYVNRIFVKVKCQIHHIFCVELEVKNSAKESQSS